MDGLPQDNAIGCCQRARAHEPHVVVLDPTLTATHGVLAGLAPGTMAVLLHPAGDVMRQVTQALRGLAQLRTVTLLVVQAPDAISRPSTAISRTQLLRRGGAWAAVADSLASDGEMRTRTVVQTGTGDADGSAVALSEPSGVMPRSRSAPPTTLSEPDTAAAPSTRAPFPPIGGPH